MDIEKELKSLLKNENELALFLFDDEWILHVGNPTNCVMLGEVPGRFVTTGHSLSKVIDEMKDKL